MALLVAACAPAFAQAPDTLRASPRPFVPGGFDDKPYLSGIFGRIAVGGYVEAHARWEKIDGVTEELGIELRRWNLLAFTEVSRAVRIWSELEVEEGGEEVRLELAQIDFLVRPGFNLRSGILLSPLGRFNLAHDAPRNELPERPLAATHLVGVALSEPGLGAFGQFAWGRRSRLTYEAYAVNGFGDGLIEDSPEGTRIPNGRGNLEANNNSPALVGRVAWSPAPGNELGLSAHRGAYNVFREEGLEIDERRDLTIAVADGELRLAGFALQGEAALVDVEIPPGLGGIYASRQGGFHLETSRAFGLGRVRSLPRSRFTGAVRLDVVDFDRDVAGDSVRRLALGLNFRPTPESVLKVAFARGESRDRFDNLARDAAVEFSVASYF